MDVNFAEGHIRFVRYDFPGATVHPTGVVTASQIRDSDWETGPPEIRSTLGETLFVPRNQKHLLEHFCRSNGITQQHRGDVWSDLLEPFLDTWFDPEHEQATANRLYEAGFPQDEVAEIRQRVSPVMYAYNSKVWGWANLNQFDLLNAASGSLVPSRLQAGLGDMTTFYRWSMQVADRPTGER